MLDIFKFNEDIKTEISFIGDNTIVLSQAGPEKETEEILAINAIAYLVHFLAVYRNSKIIMSATKEFIIDNIKADFSITRNENSNGQSDFEHFFDSFSHLISPEEKYIIMLNTQSIMRSMDIDTYNEIAKSSSLSILKSKAKYTFKLKIRNSKFYIILNGFYKSILILSPLSVLAIIDDTYFKLSPEIKTNYKEALLEIVNNYGYISLSDRNKILHNIMMRYFY